MLRDLPRQLIIKYAGIGFIIGLHWITFYGAIKLANASVALICMSTTTVIYCADRAFVYTDQGKLYGIGYKYCHHSCHDPDRQSP